LRKSLDSLLQARHDEALRTSDLNASELRRELAHAQSECARLRAEGGEVEGVRARLLAAEEAGAGLAETVRRYEADIRHLQQEVQFRVISLLGVIS